MAVWALVGAFMGWGLGGLSYAVLVHLLGARAHAGHWPHWHLLFYALLLGLPLLLALLLGWAAFRATRPHSA